MMSLEDEISHLQKENSRIESQLSRMKGDVSSSEGEVAADERVSKINLVGFFNHNDLFLLCPQLPLLTLHHNSLCFLVSQFNLSQILQDQNELKRKNVKLTDYYENLRSNVFSIFGTQNYADSYLGMYLTSN